MDKLCWYRREGGAMSLKKILKSQLTVLVLVCIMLVQHVHSSWWYLGMAGTAYQDTLTSTTLHHRTKCSEIDVLTDHQRALCSKARNVLEVLRKGASMGIEECQYQFRDRRWNCTTFNTTDVFGKVLQLQSREKAYIYAIESAGVMHAVTKACAKGDLHICNCDSKIRNTDTEQEFMWGGCSHNVRFGDKFTRQFLDLNENRMKPEGLMNLWNNKAGRKVIMEDMKLICKCHGVSGSCSARICWKTMTNFRDVGKSLKAKFDGASHVRFHRKKSKLRPIDKRQKKPNKNDLVYMQQSPDFCEQNLELGSLGTKGRLCNQTSYGLDGCSLMCCGRGYHTILREKQEDCDCKFFWCCRVECRKCATRVEEHFCN